MTSHEEDKYGMFLKVDFFLVVNALVLAFNPAIAAARTALNSLINAIAQADSTATRNTTGFTVAKNAHRASQLSGFKKVRAGVMGYYTGNPDPRKMLLIKFSDTEIDGFRDPDIYIKTDQLLDVALPIKALLGPYGVTEAEVDNLQMLNDAWPALEPSSRMEEAVNKSFNKQVDRLIAQTDTLLTDTLDNYMKVVQYNDPVIHDQYLTARMIDDSGGGSGTDGFDVENYVVPAGGSIIFPFGDAVPPVFPAAPSASPIPPDDLIYLRAINGSAIVCTTHLPASPCSSGFNLVQGVTYKGPINGLGLDLNLPYIQLTNPGLTDVVVRAGAQEE